MKFRYRSEEEMKDSGVEWIGNIPVNSEWECKKLKHLVSKTIDNRGRTPEYGESGIPMLEVKQITNGCKFPDENFEKFVDKEVAYNYIRDNIKEGDVLISTVGATSGKAVMVAKNPRYFIAQNVIGFRFKDEVDNKFIYYVLVSNYFIHSLKMINKSNTIDNLKVSIFISNTCIIPNMIEQEKIAKFLDKKTSQFDTIISKKETLIQTLEEAKKSLISEVVTGKVRVIKTSDGYELVERKKEEMKDIGVEWLEKIPFNWNVTKLKYIGDAITGLTYSPENIVDQNANGTLVLRSSNIKNGKLTLEDNVYVDMKISDKLLVREGDILICSRNGSRALIGKNACITNEYEGNSFGAFMTVFRSEYWRFLYFIFNSEIFTAQAGSFLTSTINQLTIGNLNSFIIALPKKDEQELIVSYLKEKVRDLESLKEKIQYQIQKLKEGKQALISEAVTGKIEILD